MITRDFTRCPRCNVATEKSKAINGSLSEYWYNCTKCNTFINTYCPMEHQTAVHLDAHRFIGNFGGYGTGKTTTSRQELYKHIFLTPGGNGVIGANVTSQYEQTIKRDIESDLPIQFIQNTSTQKSYIDFVNGYRLMFRPFDDIDKLRSYNIDFFLIVEASEVKAEALTQLKSRLRNLAATTPYLDPETKQPIYLPSSTGVLIPKIKADWRKGIIESNPDSGFIRSEVLLKSSNIYKHGDVQDKYSIMAEESDPAISSHIAASGVNEFLPPGFIEDLCRNKPVWWTARYVFGSFMYAEGLVYPSAIRHVVPTFEIPKHWKRIAAYDYGLSDDSVFLFGAVDEIHSLLFIYHEIRTNNRSVHDLAKMFLEAAKDIPVGGWICPPIIDPKSGPKRDYDLKTLSDHFLEYGVNFISGHINLDARIYRLNTYFECGKIKVMECCKGLIQELRDYKFKPKSLDKTFVDDKPEDKNNHAINPLEWIVMELPADPRNLVHGIYNREGHNLLGKKPKQQEVHYVYRALSDGEDNKTQTENYNPFDMVDYNF